jgi:hypothetical protein
MDVEPAGDHQGGRSEAGRDQPLWCSWCRCAVVDLTEAAALRCAFRAQHPCRNVYHADCLRTYAAMAERRGDSHLTCGTCTARVALLQLQGDPPPFVLPWSVAACLHGDRDRAADDALLLQLDALRDELHLRRLRHDAAWRDDSPSTRMAVDSGELDERRLHRRLLLQLARQNFELTLVQPPLSAPRCF